MTVTLETLEMTPEEQESSKDAVQNMAYFKWLDAGCPDCGQLEFWLAAEREWIEHHYVPRRALDGARQQSDDQPATATVGEGRQEPAPQGSRRRARAKA